MLDRRPRLPRLQIPILFAVAASLGVAPVDAQVGTTIGFGVGPISSYPDDFSGRGCEGNHVGANVSARRAVASSVALEASIAWTGSTSTSCAADALSSLAPPDGSVYRRSTIPDAIAGETFWATRIGVVLTPWEVGPIAPLLRLSGGRLWSKELWTWTWGGGVRYSFGRQGIVMEFERWHLGYEAVDETWVFREDAFDELQSRETVERRPKPWFVRIGWELSVGR